jgi:hypothetical protein
VNSGRMPNAPLIFGCQGAQGWRVEFAQRSDGTMPALDFLQNKDQENDRRDPVTKKECARFDGIALTLATNGPQGARGSFVQFIGEDARDGMAEIRIGKHMGRRLLCFRSTEGSERTILVACGFTKPNQYETPPAMRARARAILAEHRARKPGAKAHVKQDWRLQS